MAKGRNAPLPAEPADEREAREMRLIRQNAAKFIASARERYAKEGRGAFWFDSTAGRMDVRYVSQQAARTLGWPDDDGYAQSVRDYHPDYQFVVAIVGPVEPTPIYTVSFVDGAITVNAA